MTIHKKNRMILLPAALFCAVLAGCGSANQMAPTGNQGYSASGTDVQEEGTNQTKTVGGTVVRTDLSPSEMSSINAMSFKAPEEYSFVRRDVYMANGVITQIDLCYAAEDNTKGIFLRGAFGISAEEAYSGLSYTLDNHPDDIFEKEYAGVTWQMRDLGEANEPELDAYAEFGGNAYAIEYVQNEKFSELDRTMFDAVMASISLAETDEPLAINDDTVSRMSYTMPETEWRQSVNVERRDRKGNVDFRRIMCYFENYDQFSITFWSADDWEEIKQKSDINFEEYESRELGGVNAYFKLAEEGKGYYYISHSDGVYQIAYYFSPVTEEREAFLKQVLDSVSFE